MIRRCPLAVLVFLTTVCSGAELSPRYQELQRVFQETEPFLVAIEREMEKDDLWQLVPHYIDGAFDEPHVPELTSDQIVKYRDLLDLVLYVSYVDKVDDRTDFSLGRVTTNRWHFYFQFIHTTRRARPANCDESRIRGTCGVCSSDLGNDWALWVSWTELSDEVSENGCTSTVRSQ